MGESKKLQIIWSKFQENIRSYYGEIREEGEFSDVTLFSEGQEIKAHKVILSASSPVLKHMLSSHQHAHPLIYMNRVKSKTLCSIIDFIYFGEVSICEENLNDFISLGEELELKGLNGNLTKHLKDAEESPSTDKKLFNQIKPSFIKDNEEIVDSIDNGRSIEKNMFEEDMIPIEHFIKDEQTKLLSTEETKDTIQLVLPEESKVHKLLGGCLEREKEYNLIAPFIPVIVIPENALEKINEIVEKRQASSGKYIWTCTVCNFVSKNNKISELKVHAEKHVEGLNYTCKVCGQIKKTSQNLHTHYNHKHNIKSSTNSWNTFKNVKKC